MSAAMLTAVQDRAAKTLATLPKRIAAAMAKTGSRRRLALALLIAETDDSARRLPNDSETSACQAMMLHQSKAIMGSLRAASW